MKIDLQALSEGQIYRLFTSQLAFTSLGEYVLGVGLLYSFRHFERRMGTSKFLALTFLVGVISLSAQIAMLLWVPDIVSGVISSGPYGFIFSFFVQFFAHVPKLHRYSFLGLEVSDKSFVYMIGAQLALNHGTSSFFPSLIGFLAGLIVSSDKFPFNKFRLPRIVERTCERIFLPFLNSSSSIENAIENQARMFQQQNQFGQQQTENAPIGANQGVYRREQLTGRFPMFDNFQAPAPARVVAPPPLPVQPSEEAINALVGMGFDRQECEEALRRNNNNVDNAANYLLSNIGN